VRERLAPGAAEGLPRLPSRTRPRGAPPGGFPRQRQGAVQAGIMRQATRRDPMTPITRPKLDGFDFLDYLGGSAFGQVRKARDVKINLIRAVKVLTRERFRECDASETTCGVGCPFHVESQYGRRP